MNELSHRKNDHILRFHLLLGDMIDDDSRRQMTRAIAYIERESKNRVIFLPFIEIIFNEFNS